MYKERIKDSKKKETGVIDCYYSYYYYQLFPPAKTNPSSPPPLFFFFLSSLSLWSTPPPPRELAQTNVRTITTARNQLFLLVPSQPTFLHLRPTLASLTLSLVRATATVIEPPDLYHHEAAPALLLTDLEFGKRERRAKKQPEETKPRKSSCTYWSTTKTFQTLPPRFIHTYIHPTSHIP